MDPGQTKLPPDLSQSDRASIFLCDLLGKFSGISSGYNYVQVTAKTSTDAQLGNELHKHPAKEMAKLATKDGSGLNLDIGKAMFIYTDIGANEDPYDDPPDHNDLSVRPVFDRETKLSPIGIVCPNSDGNLHMSFRGTQSVIEIDNSTGKHSRWLNGDKKPISTALEVLIDGNMRAGIADSMNRNVPILGTVNDQIRYCLDSLAKDGAALYVAGHSWGGGVSSAGVLIADDMKRFTTIRCTLLGSLNIFDDAGIKAVSNLENVRIINVVDENDPIPTWGSGKTPFAVLGERVTIATGKPYIVAHLMANYVSCIEKQLNAEAL